MILVAVQRRAANMVSLKRDLKEQTKLKIYFKKNLRQINFYNITKKTNGHIS